MTPQELKNSILQLAIQGKLVDHRLEEGTGKELLEKILRNRAAETTKQTRITGKAKVKSRVASRASSVSSVSSVPVVPPIPDDEKPFDIPESWEWVRLGDCVSNRAGLAYSRGNLDVKGAKMIRVLRGGNIADMGYSTKPDDVMISDEFVNPELFLRRNMLITPAVTSLDHVGKMARIEDDYDDMVVGGFVLMLTPQLNDDVFSRYLLCVCSSKYFRDCCRTIVNKSGQAFYNLSRTKMMDQLIPLPPLAEQKRIVAKIEELLPLIDRYEKAWSKLEDFNKRFPGDMQKSLLQMAIQGKLVDHRPEEGTAAELLEKILATKNAKDAKKNLTRSRGARGEKKTSASPREKIPDNEKPFDIPESWEWVRLGDISSQITKGTTPRGGNVSYSDKGVGFLRAENIAGLDVLDKSNLKYIDEKTHMGALRRSILEANDILITIAGTLGRTAIVRDNDLPLNANQAVSMIRLVNAKSVSLKYIVIALNGPMIQRILTKQRKVTAIPNLTLEIIRDCLVPLPPLAEQKRIVAKLEEILPLCERLK